MNQQRFLEKFKPKKVLYEDVGYDTFHHGNLYACICPDCGLHMTNQKRCSMIDKHIQYAKNLTREALLYGHCAVTPHLYMTDCLNDADPDERMLGLEAALELLEKCDAVIVGQRYGISEGMAAEIAQAKKLNIPIFYRDKKEGSI